MELQRVHSKLRTKSKFVFARPSKKVGGLSKEIDPNFTTSDVVIEITIKPSSKKTSETPATKESIRVLGWEASYSAEAVGLDSFKLVNERKSWQAMAHE